MAATTNRDWRKADDGPDGNMAMGPWDHEPKRGPHGDAISRWSRDEKEQGLIHSMPPLSAWTRRCCAAHGQIWQCLRRKLMNWMKGWCWLHIAVSRSADAIDAGRRAWATAQTN